jgi:ADP-ribosylglycohydrolase
LKGAFLGSLVADALALSTHYEYDAVKIKKFYGKIDKYYAPGEKTGGQTHGVGWGQVMV